MQPHQVSYLWSQIHISPTDHRLFSWPTFAIGDVNSRHGEQDELLHYMDSHVKCHPASSWSSIPSILWPTVVYYLEPRKWSYEGRGDGFCKPHVLHDMDATGSIVIAPPHPTPHPNHQRCISYCGFLPARHLLGIEWKYHNLLQYQGRLDWMRLD